MIEDMIKLGATTVLVDGAIFRLSSSSPFITDGVILATGAALSLNKYELLKKTKHKVNLMKLPEVSQELRKKLSSVIEALWLVDDKGELEKNSHEDYAIRNRGSGRRCFKGKTYIRDGITF